jgi:hypothetical protein
MSWNDTTPRSNGEMPVTALQRPFRLFGSMRLNVPEHEFDTWLDENRSAQADLLARKLQDL